MTILQKPAALGIALLLDALLVLSPPALAWDSFVGQEPCAFVATQMEQDDEIVGLIIAAFITGTNFATNRAIDADMAEMTSWVREFCIAQPSVPFLEALIRLDEELDSRQKELDSAPQ